MQQLTQQQNFGRVEGLCQLGVAEVVVRAAERDSIVIGQIVQHGQEIESFRVPFSVIVGTNLVAFQELGDEGKIAQGFELMADAASELLEGGSIGSFYKHDCTSSKIFFVLAVKVGKFLWESRKKSYFYNSKTIVRTIVENSVEALHPKTAEKFVKNKRKTKLFSP